MSAVIRSSIMEIKQTVHKSAVAVIPPKSVWDSIQKIRQQYDKSFVRWMPHINMLYPFAVDYEFEKLQPAAEQALSQVAPFELSFNKFEYFQHGKKSSTLWLRPDENGDGKESLQEIENLLVSAFPACTDLISRGEAGFQPHLTVGQFKGAQHVQQFQSKFQKDWSPIKFTVDCLYFISRTDDDPFEVRKIIPLQGKTVQDVTADFTEHPPTTSPPRPDQFKLMVNGLPPSTSKADLQALLSSKIPEIVSITIPVDNRTKQQRGYAFVEAAGMPIEAALHAFAGTDLDLHGHLLSVKQAH